VQLSALPNIVLREADVTSPIVEFYKQLSRHKFLFCVVAFLVTSVVTCVVLSLQTRYTASASISILPTTPDPLQVNGGSESGPRDDEVSTQALLITSRDLATDVVEKLALGAIPAPAGLFKEWTCRYPALASHFVTWCSPARSTTLSSRVNAFLGSLRATPTPRSRLIELTYTNSDPDLAALVLNTLIEIYQRQQLAQRAEDLARTSNWVSQRAEELRRNWLEAAAKAGSYKAGSGLTPIGSRDGDSPLIMQQVGSSASALSAAQADLAAAKSRWDTLKTAANARDKTMFISMRDEPVLTALASQLSVLRAKRAELTSNFGTTHPDVSAVVLQITAVERLITAEETRALGSLQTNVAAKQAVVDNISSSLDRLKDDADKLTTKRVELSTLEDEATSAKAVFETFLARAKQLDDRASLLQSQIRVAAHATVPEAPSFPKTSQFLLGGMFLGLVCGAAAALTREHLSRGFNNISRVGRQLSLPLLSAIPAVSRFQRRRLAYYVREHPFSAAAESVRGLATQIHLAAGTGNAARSVVIVSATGEEGKTTASLWLAGAVAASGQKVLLIDADHRHGMISQRLGGHRGTGFSELVFDNISTPDVIQRDDQQNFDFIGAGCAVARPFGRNEVGRLRGVIKTFEEHYDLVIIDTAPMLALNDALIYASLASSTVFLCRWKRTSRQAVMNCVDRLRAVNAKLLGISLSMVDQNRLPDFSDDYTRHDVKVMKRYYVAAR
jgi:capsular exopolysaccharide synthesis family protein